MENKEFPELEFQDIPAEEVPVPTEEILEAPAENSGFVDYFADIAPEEQQDTIPAPAEEPMVTADTTLLREIQSAVESIISQEITAGSEVPTDSEESAPEVIPLEDVSFIENPEFEQEEQLPEESEPISEDDCIKNDGFEEMHHADASEAPVLNFDRLARKGRPKRRKGEFLFGIPQIAVTCVWLAIILVTGITLGRMLWVCAADVLAFGREDKMVTVTVYESDTMEDIIEKLHENDLIRYPGLFKLYADPG